MDTHRLTNYTFVWDDLTYVRMANKPVLSGFTTDRQHAVVISRDLHKNGPYKAEFRTIATGAVVYTKYLNRMEMAEFKSRIPPEG